MLQLNNLTPPYIDVRVEYIFLPLFLILGIGELSGLFDVQVVFLGIVGPAGCRHTIFRQVILSFLQLMVVKLQDGYRTEMDIDAI
jgi:hypothetical protein